MTIKTTNVECNNKHIILLKRKMQIQPLSTTFTNLKLKYLLYLIFPNKSQCLMLQYDKW